MSTMARIATVSSHSPNSAGNECRGNENPDNEFRKLPEEPFPQSASAASRPAGSGRSEFAFHSTC